jgi:hypothetical protein
MQDKEFLEKLSNILSASLHWVTTVKVQNKDTKIHYDIEPDIKELQQEVLKRLNV